jgi:ubiquinone biosynthesis protein
MARINVRSVRHFQRYREIAQVLLRHGLGELIELLELLPYLSFPRRVLGKGRQPPQTRGIPQRMRLAMEELGPTFVKLGQVLSTRPDLLPPEYIAEFVKLRSTVPPAPWEEVQELLESELGAPILDVFSTFDIDPIAAASLSQVHAATLPDGSDVVAKIQRPGIKDIIATDLEILHSLARLVQDRIAIGQVYDLPGIAEEFASTLRAELDFYHEGHNADRFRENFTHERHLHIPVIYWDYTTRHVLVMERLRGISLQDTEALDAAGYSRHRIASHAAQILLKEILDDGFFHADPHPGNFVVLPGEIIGAMDFGMVGYLGHQTRLHLTRLYNVIIQSDDQGVVDQLIRIGAVRGPVDRAGLSRDTSRLLRKYQGLPLKSIRIDAFMNELMPVAFRHHINLPNELWLLIKSLAMMEGVAIRLDPDFDIFEVFKPYLRHFVLGTVSPESIGPAALKAATEWAELVGLFPRVGYQLLRNVEQGGLEFSMEHKGLNLALSRLDRLVSRLALSILLAALIIGLALIVPVLHPEAGLNLASVAVIAGFTGTVLLSFLLVISILRSR